MGQRPDLLHRLREETAARAVLDAVGRRDGVHVVGGAVRDALLGRTPRDLDFVVEGRASEVATAVAERLDGELREHDRFGTASVSAGGHTYDFASSRQERYLRPGALPDVSPGALEDDLSRRDFTVNAMALALGARAPGALLAIPHALDDLDKRQLRVLHDASFRDDPTRLMRLARYAARLGFDVDPHTAGLARDAIAAGVLDTLSSSRVGQELRLAACEDDPLAVFGRMGEWQLLRAVDPHLGIDTGFARRALAALPADGRNDLVVLAAAVRDVPAGEVAPLLERLGFDRDETRLGVAFATRLPTVARTLAAARRPSEIDVLLAGSTVEEAALTAALGAERAVRRWVEELRHITLEIDGDDLRAAGVPGGPAIGTGLAAARAGRIDGELMTRETQLAAALRMART